MISLRRRLTIAYTVIVGAFIGFVAIVLTWLALDAVVRPIGLSIQAAAREGRAIVAAQPQIGPEAVAARVRAFAAQPDVAVFVTRAPRGGPPPDAGPPPGGGGPPGFGPDGPPGPRAGPPGPMPGNGIPNRLLDSIFGLHGEFVPVGRMQVAIVPQRAPLEARARQYVVVLGVLLVFALLAAWLIARWIADQAVAPLIAVTAELDRFAGGDFSPRSVPLARFSDVAPLIAAYNGAAEQVSAAFEERERAELRMRRFLADAGHELRTPLTIVTAYVDVLRKGGHEDAKVRAQAFSTLTSETQRMRRLVDRLVALARLEQPETTQPVVVDIGALARDVVAAIGTARGGNVACEVESGTFVRADPADVHEAIGNLVDNALKYGAGTPVRVAVEHERDGVVVRVGDRGPGIAPEDREKIFERFYRGAGLQDVEGSGLGLAIAARAAKRAGGELALERSAPGETVFTLRLPLHVPVSVG